MGSTVVYLIVFLMIELRESVIFWRSGSDWRDLQESLLTSLLCLTPLAVNKISISKREWAAVLQNTMTVNKTDVSCCMTVAYGCDFSPALRDSTMHAGPHLVSIKWSETLSVDFRLLSDTLKDVRLTPLPSQGLTILPYLLGIFF